MSDRFSLLVLGTNGHRSSIRVHVDKPDNNTPGASDAPLLSGAFDDSLASSGTRTPSDDEGRTYSLRNTPMLVPDNLTAGDGRVRPAAGHCSSARAGGEAGCSASKDSPARGRPHDHVLDRAGRKLSPQRAADNPRGTGTADPRPHPSAVNTAATRATKSSQAAAPTDTGYSGETPPIRAPERIRVRGGDGG